MTAVPEVYVVVRQYTFDKDEYVAADLVRDPAEKHCAILNGGEVDAAEHAVWTIPLRHAPPEEP